MHFIDLSLLMEGGHIGSVYDWKTKKVPIKFCSPPWCCTGLIFKDIYYDKYVFLYENSTHYTWSNKCFFQSIGRKKLRFMKGLVYQTPLIQLVINMLVSVLEAAGVLTRQVMITTSTQIITRLCDWLFFLFLNFEFRLKTMHSLDSN